MKINSLVLTNFKGIKSFRFEPEGKDIAVCGDNGTGKTTLFDAFTWLLFGKDSQNKADFAIKTLDEKGEPIPGLDHEVEGIFELDGQTLTLRRVYHEVWTKQRGSATKQFTGHTTDHFIDGVPVKKNEYEDRIASIIDEQIFRLLADPRHFNEVLPWEKRREILIKVVGNVSDADIIATNKSLGSLPEILNGHKLVDYKKIVAARKKAINSELEAIPQRIDEVNRGLPNYDGHLTPLTDLLELKSQRSAKAQELANLEAGGGIAEATKKLREVEGELVQIQKDCWLENSEKVQAAKIELRKLQDEVADLHATIKSNQRMIVENNQQIETLEQNIDTLRAHWQAVHDLQMTHIQEFEDTKICPTCGQALPTEQVTQVSKTDLAKFNREKARELEQINNTGKHQKERLETLHYSNPILEKDIANHQEQLGKDEQKIADITIKVAEIEANGKSYEDTVAYVDNKNRKLALENQIAELKRGNTGAVEVIKQAIWAIDGQISKCESIIAQMKQREKGLARIEELKAQEKILAAEFEKLEGELSLMEKFIRARVDLLTDKINSKFQLAKFKMFNTLVNGGTEECCETLVEGVPYSSGLNHGAQINVGLDIIRTLQIFYEFHPPVWIDRRESVTKIIPMDCQVISLIVSEFDKMLRIVTGKSGEAEMTPSQRSFEHELDKVKEKALQQAGD